VTEPRLTRRHLLVAAAAGTAALAGCSSSAATATPQVTTPPPPTPTAAPSTTTPSPTPSAIDLPALRRKIASLLIVGFRGATAPSWVLNAIKDQGLGGIILFDRDQLTGGKRNINNPDQVKALTKSLIAASPDKRLIISIDQEGGQIARLNPGNGFAATASQASIGAKNSTGTTHAWAQKIVGELTSIQANLNFAPVVDMNVNSSNPAIGALGRSFSKSADVVVSCASEEIKVHRSAGIVTVLKHFPGFGSATGNTDFGVVDVTKTWHSYELEPFQRLIDAGLADLVMAAHLLNRQLDPDRPASLSHAVVTGLLRGKLGYKGAVVSDDMQAVAISSKYGRAEATTLAFEAGVDLLVYANQESYDANIVTETVNTLTGLVQSGHISEASIDAAVARVDAIRPHN
jgi:beta-N-acetylhexosaminidase